MAEFAQALLVIPRTLAVNGAFDATDLVAQLRAYHHAAQSDTAVAGAPSAAGGAEKDGYKYTGMSPEFFLALFLDSTVRLISD